MWQIVRKEVHHNLLGLRFAVGTAVVAAMMGIVGYVLLSEHVAEQQGYIAATQKHERDLAETKVYSKLSVTVDFPPSPLAMFSRGVGDLPSWVTVSPYQVPTLLQGGGGASLSVWDTGTAPHNPLLRVFSRIDLVFVIRIVLSLFALLMAFDSFSGERERGTLPMVMACPVRRLEVAGGKFLGALLTVALPLTVGFLTVLVLWSLSHAVVLEPDVWIGVGLIYVASLMYLAAFLALAIGLSLWAAESSSALMALLLAWVTAAVVVPEGLGYLTQYMRPREARTQMQVGHKKELERYEVRYWEMAKDHPQRDGWWGMNGGGFQGGEALLGTSREEVEGRRAFVQQAYPLKFEAAEDLYRLAEPYERALLGWAAHRRNLLRLSLCSVYGNLVEVVAGSDLASHEAALTQARTYQKQLMEYLHPKVSEAAWFTRLPEHPEMETTPQNLALWQKRQQVEGDDVLWREILTWDKVAPLDLTAMPRPVIRRPGLASRLETAWPDAALLVTFLAASLAWMGWQALRARIMA